MIGDREAPFKIGVGCSIPNKSNFHSGSVSRLLIDVPVTHVDCLAGQKSHFPNNMENTPRVGFQPSNFLCTKHGGEESPQTENTPHLMPNPTKVSNKSFAPG
jgi:hypothetical protein